MKKYIFLMLCIIMYINGAEKVLTKKEILEKIQAIYNSSKNNIKEQNTQNLKCNLSKEKLDSITLDLSEPIFPYYNILLEIDNGKKASKLAQDLLMKEAKNNNSSAIILALQLYFTRQCERCEKIRDISNFDYYRFSDSNIAKLLSTEGGSFNNSFVLKGEAFLCRALESKIDSKAANLYINSYVNFMLAGLNTRAINVLMQGLKKTNDNVLFATFKFLASNDIVIINNIYGIYLLNILELDSKKHFNNISILNHFKNLKVIEGDVVSNYVILGLIIRDMNMGRILSPFNKLATNETKEEFKNKLTHYENELKKANLRILQNANAKEIYEYYKILQFKEVLKTQNANLNIKMLDF